MAVEAAHWGALPSTVAEAMVTALEELLYDGTRGCVRQVARIEADTPEAVKQAAALGTPALFVFYDRTKYTANSADGRHFKGDMAFRVLACAPTWLAKVRRLGGDASIDYSAVLHPKEIGVEELAEWSGYMALRAAIETTGTSGCKLVESVSGEQIDPGLWVAGIDIVVSRQVDVYDDPPVATLQSIGLVHNPADENALWADPGTDENPDSDDWGDEVDGGHYQLPDE